MTFRVTIARGYVTRILDVDANTEPHARLLAEHDLAPGEVVQRVTLLSRVTVDPCPRMPADHARAVATGRPVFVITDPAAAARFRGRIRAGRPASAAAPASGPQDASQTPPNPRNPLKEKS